MKKLTFIVLTVLITSLLSATCFAAEYPQIQIKGTIKYIVSEGTYGILSDDNKKYQPVKPLPKEYRKDGLEVVVDARLRKDIVAARMWGTAVEVAGITRADLFISSEEWQAIKLLLLRLDAFNSRNLSLLKQVDIMARPLNEEQFTAWLAGYGNYILHYAEASRMDENTITGFALYSRELVNGLALSGNVQHSLMRFTISKFEGEWKFAETKNYKPDTEDADSFIADLKAKSKKKFGTNNLAKWKG